MNAVMAQVRREHPGALEGWQALVIPLYQEIVGPSQRLLSGLAGRGGPGVADCLRECRESAARTRPRCGSGRSPCARRWARAVGGWCGRC